MANWSDPNTATRPDVTGFETTQGAVYDSGLRSYMLSVYNYMASGVLLTGITALLFAQSGIAEQIFVNGGILKWVVVFAPLAFVFAFGAAVNRMSTTGLQAMFWAFTVLMGLSLSSIFLIFSGSSIAQTFFATAAAFASLSLWGYTTKKDLSGWGSFLIMGVVGLIVASLLNIFMASSTLHWAISFLGVLIFAGLTAYDTQKIKSMYTWLRGSDMIGKAAIMGALSLYLDFVNMFQFLLSFMGDRE